MQQKQFSGIINSSGLLAFIRDEAETAVSSLKKAHPEIAPYLTQEAYDCLTDNFSERMENLYFQCLQKEIRDAVTSFDPVGVMLGQINEDALTKAAREIDAKAGGAVGRMLREKYPLITEYREQIYSHYIGCFSDFFKAFIREKAEISQRFLGGKTIGKILHLSSDGADLHRNGRSVIGVTTDAGRFFYKPHDCGLDLLYQKIVAGWFSDCTIAADVIRGDTYAFVSCLEHEEVQKESGIREYYYHFGILSALFHGLGSIDMHYENILAAGDKPACVDAETILRPGDKDDAAADRMELTDAERSIADSLVRTGLLPLILYKGTMFSPLYVSRRGHPSLPRFEGRACSVQGYEEDYRRGFHEGYARMLAHREEIKALIDSCKGAVVRCVLHNTKGYTAILSALFAPENLRGEKERENIHKKFRGMYKNLGSGSETEIIDHEWACLLKGDIPYFCSTVGGRDLCGEEPGQIIKAGFFKTSVKDASFRFLDRLSEQEEAFEQELIRVCLSNAPVEEEKEDRTMIIPGEIPEERILKEELSGALPNIKQNAITCTDGSLMWISNALVSEVSPVLSDTVSSDIGMLAAKMLTSLKLPDSDAAFSFLAERICAQISERMERIEGSAIGAERLQDFLPTGLFSGWGGILLSCHKMAEAHVKGARQLCTKIVRFVAEKELYRSKRTDLAEGIAGLCIALSMLAPEEESRRCIRFCAERLLTEELPDRADAPYGCAGIGAALAAAYGCLNEEKYAIGALRVFDKIKEAYRENLGGWPDGNASRKWLADKGPHEAGIWLAADFALEKMPGIEGTELLRDLRETALSCLLKQETLEDRDTLYDGNALSVLALLKAGRKEKAENILSAMLSEKERKGTFRTMRPGTKSSFDPSFYMGTAGIYYAMIVYLEHIDHML